MAGVGEKESLVWLSHANAGFAARLVLGSIFIYAGLGKIIYLDRFAEAIANYHLLPGPLVQPIAIWLSWLEVISGSLLVVGTWMGGSIATLIGLLLVFLGALSFNLARGLNISCGCFSSQAASATTILELLRDMLLLILACYLCWLYQIKRIEPRFSLTPPWARSSGPLERRGR